MMALRGNAGTGIQTGGGTVTGVGEGRLHGSEDSTNHTAHTYGPGDFPDTPHRHLLSSSTRHPLVVNDATLMIESSMDRISLGGSHVSGYTMGSIPEAGHLSTLSTLLVHSSVPSHLHYSLSCTHTSTLFTAMYSPLNSCYLTLSMYTSRHPMCTFPSPLQWQHHQ